MNVSTPQEQYFADLPLRISGVAPNIIRELSGIYPTFVSAFKELISNAYDADATLVTIHLSSDMSTITIEDNGTGMTPFEFQNEYIRIGGSEQRQGANLTTGGRLPIGRKGIGFLAVARYCRRVQVHSHTNREVTLCDNVNLEPSGRALFFQGPFAQALAPFTTVQAVQCGSVELSPDEYRQDGLSIEVTTDVSDLTIQYTVNCGCVDVQASIDYDYLLNLRDNHNLETLQDFCHIRLTPRADLTQPPFTRITLQLHKFVQHELQAPQRRGHVRNVASFAGLDRFLWHLSRSVPLPYNLSSQELERHNLEALTVSTSPTPFAIRVTDADDGTRQLRRPLLGETDIVNLEESILVRQPIYIESDGLAAQGHLLGFAQPIFPAELRGIAIRVRGVEIGRPDLLGVENDLLVKYRPFLSQVMGEVIVTQGLDATSAITPGRAGFYAESTQFQTLRRHLVGDGVAELGALGWVLEQLWEQRSVKSSAARIVQETRRRREAFLDISQALTGLSVGSRYGRALRRLFSRSDIAANGLEHAPEHQFHLPDAIGNYVFELSDSVKEDCELDVEHGIVRLNRNADMWDSSLYILNRDFEISLRDGKPDDPLCEIDFSTDTIYVNWMHPTRTKMGDAMFVKSALSWRIAYLAAAGDVDLMMNLAHRLLSFST
jgi:hypothetical protein